MSDLMHVNKMEDFNQFLNENNVIEIVIRNKKKKFKQFQKVVIDQLPNKEKAEKVKEAIQIINKNNMINVKNMKLLNTVAKLNKFNLVLNGLNLCATSAGFVIMYQKLDKISAQINEVVDLYKKGAGIQANYEYKKVLSEHSNMLDCRKKQNYYSENQMRELVDAEANVLDYLFNIISLNLASNNEDLITAILSLAQMLSASIRYFDEIYYFNNAKAIGGGNLWHDSHEQWVALYDRMITEEFTEILQDCGVFEMGLNMRENDCFYVNCIDQIKSLKQDIVDNQMLIKTINDRELFKAAQEMSNEEIRKEIEASFEKVGLGTEVYDKAFRAAVMC